MIGCALNAASVSAGAQRRATAAPSAAGLSPKAEITGAPGCGTAHVAAPIRNGNGSWSLAYGNWKGVMGKVPPFEPLRCAWFAEETVRQKSGRVATTTYCQAARCNVYLWEYVRAEEYGVKQAVTGEALLYPSETPAATCAGSGISHDRCIIGRTPYIDAGEGALIGQVGKGQFADVLCQGSGGLVNDTFTVATIVVLCYPLMVPSLLPAACGSQTSAHARGAVSAVLPVGGRVGDDLAAVAAQAPRRCGITARGAEADGFLVPANSWCELTAGGPEDELRVTATGLEPGTAYDLTLGGKDGGYAPDVTIGSFTTDATGGFEGLFSLPAIAGRDAWTLTARPTAGGGQPVSTALTTDEVYCLYFNIAPGTGSVEVHWSGVGFRPDSSFTLLLDGRRIATDRSDANGTLETLSGSVACPPGQVDTFTSEGPFLDGPGQPEVTRLDCDTGQTNQLG